ncbi:MAG: ribbon-helix-helix domain-containing protein [Lachnospiraceae bacterium]|nr:ribbon-helix-helix domain-containing protein [Lachnospiraceae bacterium]
MSANTSWQAIHRYKQKVYKRITADLPKELVARWEEKLKAEGVTKTEFIRSAIKTYLGDA